MQSLGHPVNLKGNGSSLLHDCTPRLRRSRPDPLAYKGWSFWTTAQAALLNTPLHTGEPFSWLPAWHLILWSNKQHFCHLSPPTRKQRLVLSEALNKWHYSDSEMQPCCVRFLWLHDIYIMTNDIHLRKYVQKHLYSASIWTAFISCWCQMIFLPKGKRNMKSLTWKSS